MWGLVDCDNFFCSCERVFRPELARKPVVVLSNNDGCVVALSREVKKMGIKLGLPYYQLLEQYPNSGITAFSSNYKLYGDMSARVMAVIREEVPRLHQYSIDEGFMDLRGIPVGDLKAFGERLSKKVMKWTGIPVTFGMAPTKTLAKVAARFGKNYPGYNKCCVIADDEQRIKALQLFKAEDVWGIGRRIAKKLNYAGVVTAYDFTQKTRAWVKSRFHVPGERTWLELRGEDVIGVDEMDAKTKQSIVTSRSFPDMITHIDLLREHFANYAARCAMKLRRQATVCSMVTVFLQSNFFREDLPQYSNSGSYIFTTPTSATPEIVSAALNTLEKIFLPGIHYKRGGVMVSEITSAKAIQPDLFDYDAGLSRKYRTLSEAIDEINARLGADTVILASQQYTKRDETGKSVKFSHAIKRALLSPDYSTSIEAFTVK
ncbi:MAG: Y-family DNA polymerase [Muribaculaceae bacterium]|nr:Y-family DNA polymerase [Muribaculaceae bacterium]